jgi:hypothetical protein
MIAVAGVNPVMGIRRANAAMLGMVYNKPETEITGK